MQKLADISLFMSYSPTVCGTYAMNIFNSEAAASLQQYDKLVKSKALCDKYITEMQQEEYVPVDVITKLYETREQYDVELMKLKSDLMAHVADSSFDAFDREIYKTLADETKAELSDVLKADEVFRRAMEMQSEEIASNEQTEVADEEAPAQETEASPEDAEATAAAAEETAGNDITAFATGEEEQA
jgi:hypothetical protein